VLSAAGAPQQLEEMEGEAAALAAFRTAHAAQPAAVAAADQTSPRRRLVLKSSLLSLLTTKAAMAAAATAAVGTVTLAAATGALPNPVSGGPGDTSGPAQLGVASSSARLSATPKATPSPSMVGLCHAFLAGATSNPGKAAANPAFTALATAAGGAAKIPTYCATLLPTKTAKASGKPSALPGPALSHRPSQAGGHGTGHPTGRPAGLPAPDATHPTGRPVTGPAAGSSGTTR